MNPSACLAHIDAHLRDLATTPEACGQSAEAPLFTVLSLLEARAALTCAPNPRAAYEDLLRERWGGTSYPASYYLGVGRIGAFLTALLDRVLADADCRSGDAAKTVPEPAALPSEPPAAQASLPGMAPPVKVRRRSQHRFGLLRWETVPATEIVPEHQVALATCAHCKTVRRRANTGKRLGAKDTYSKDGVEWSGVSPVCIPKR